MDGGPNMDRFGRPYVANRAFVSLVDLFDADDHGEVHLDDEFDGFDLDLAHLDALLVGECHRCATPVDHRRRAKVSPDPTKLMVEIAIVPPFERTWHEPANTREALDLGWTVAPICPDCRRRDLHGRFDLVMERWRAEGTIRR
jgi:hypothetical protein